MAEVLVRFQPTPNPNAGKFVTDRQVVAGSRAQQFSSAAQAEGHPLASALLGLEGVRSVFMVEDFVTVTKAPEVDWAALIPRVEAAIRENL